MITLSAFYCILVGMKKCMSRHLWTNPWVSKSQSHFVVVAVVVVVVATLVWSKAF